jgi:hypothetical protein
VKASLKDSADSRTAIESTLAFASTHQPHSSEYLGESAQIARKLPLLRKKSNRIKFLVEDKIKMKKVIFIKKSADIILSIVNIDT